MLLAVGAVVTVRAVGEVVMGGAVVYGHGGG